MAERNDDFMPDQDEMEAADPLGERAFAEGGFEDAPGGGPDLTAPGMEGELERRPGGGGQKVAGVPAARQHETTTPSDQRPDTAMGVIKERGGESKGDPAVGGTRAD